LPVTPWASVHRRRSFPIHCNVDLKLDKGSQFDIGTEHEDRALYLLNGEIGLAEASITPGRLVVLKTGSPVTIEARQDTHLVIIGGAQLDGPRHIWWNFVSSSRERIEQAKQDWREGRFARVIDDEIEFIPLPGEED
jgi:redox-sensitive bicupin YhaK (pirin superfamily)